MVLSKPSVLAGVYICHWCCLYGLSDCVVFTCEKSWSYHWSCAVNETARQQCLQGIVLPNLSDVKNHEVLERQVSYNISIMFCSFSPGLLQHTSVWPSPGKLKKIAKGSKRCCPFGLRTATTKRFNTEFSIKLPSSATKTQICSLPTLQHTPCAQPVITQVIMPRFQLQQFGERPFSRFAPSLWNTTLR